MILQRPLFLFRLVILVIVLIIFLKPNYVLSGGLRSGNKLLESFERKANLAPDIKGSSNTEGEAIRRNSPEFSRFLIPRDHFKNSIFLTFPKGQRKKPIDEKLPILEYYYENNIEASNYVVKEVRQKKSPSIESYSSLNKSKNFYEFKRNYQSKVSNLKLSDKGKKTAVDFASSFFASHYDQKIGDSILVYVGAIEPTGKNVFKKVFGSEKYEMAIFTKGDCLTPFGPKQGKPKTLTANNSAEWLRLATEKIGELNQKNPPYIIVYGDGVPGVSFNKSFYDLGIPVIRVSNPSESYASQLGGKIEAFKSNLADLKPSNTIVCNGLPANEAELQNIDKDIKNLDRWIDANSNLIKKCVEKNIQNKKGNTEVFKEALAEGKDVVVIVADARKGHIRWPDKTFLSIEDVKSIKKEINERSLNGVFRQRQHPPIAIVLCCEAASSFKVGTVGEIITELCNEGIISGAKAPVDFIRPDTIFEAIDNIMENPSLIDKNLNFENHVFDAEYYKTYRRKVC